ncbi:hypothetical protein Mterra_02777 [Calidithermus terrae]|uniref:DUF2269 family protein n=1 Tax=Calidithermus terrae TaxID=1408545 RepID=A0A399EE25_9DEIN|nr:hypothetical protein [Calidithermus terrae]RIH82168.1 hypothetical protein Mterra_02777 [Calidithermus terrae]
MRLIILTHFCATWALVGLIWTLQVVNLPLFAKVGENAFSSYEANHSLLLPQVMGTLMFIELVTGIVLVVFPPGWVPSWVFMLGLGLLALIWGWGLLVQAPLQRRLARRFDPQALSLLVYTNWLRTLAWSARGLLLAWAMLRYAL